MAQPLQVLLYVSELARNAEREVVHQIALESRANNARDDITGLLVFDGGAFAQYVEGPPRAIDGLFHRLQADKRHRDMEVVQSGPVQSRRFPSWRLGYLRLDFQEFGILSLRGKTGAAAIEAFDFILPALDIQVGDAQPARI